MRDTEEVDCDTDLERQNVEELYDYVRRLHQRQEQQRGEQEPPYDVQHAALIPVLRPYQSQAVNWMLRRERFRLSSPTGMVLRAGRYSVTAPLRSQQKLLSTDPCTQGQHSYHQIHILIKKC